MDGPAVWLCGHGVALGPLAAAAVAGAAAATLLVQKLSRHLEAGRGQKAVALPAHVAQRDESFHF